MLKADKKNIFFPKYLAKFYGLLIEQQNDFQPSLEVNF